MKTLLRLFLYSTFALWLTQVVSGGLKIAGGLETQIIAGAALAFIYLFVKPILKLFFLPINLLSLGLLSWLINVAILYVLTLMVPQITISAWQFSGLSYQGFSLPSYYFSQTTSFVASALILSFFINFLVWLSK
ncbi:MAG: phage holin family protein [Patescibacteria group bacterium]|nr:phage holin family protein [Patescibacteria group bacterium]MCL5095383.1 phage holin family protein [Patescibacteria group bacterium]